ncbi:RNA-directed DNA polymerase from mobile element jockey [Trichonephila clavipes]|nr:RNA-directed DNA polymerase from mobile element jockey [Trichonephila clavipes]
MWHDGLTYKLIKLQFPDYLIKIIHFLHNRTFRVRVNNSYSSTGSCLSGVPQGSVLSPYLYNIYTHDFPQHSTVSTCLFADDSAVLSQGVQLKYTIKTVQHFLDKLETWLTHWRIAINVDKSQAIVFRKWGVIDPPFQLTLFDDNIQWVSVVKYLGLHIDSRLTFKKHIDYLSEKFWGRISLAISLVGRRSPLSLENKVILYKQILRPVITYGSPVWGAAAATHMKKIQVMQNKILRVMTNAPWHTHLCNFPAEAFGHEQVDDGVGGSGCLAKESRQNSANAGKQFGITISFKQADDSIRKPGNYVGRGDYGRELQTLAQMKISTGDINVEK